MPWWILAIIVAVMILIIFLISQYVSKPGKENFSEMIKKGKINEVKKKAKDLMEVYEAYQEAET